MALQDLGGLEGLFDIADEEEGEFGHVVVLALDQPLKPRIVSSILTCAL